MSESPEEARLFSVLSRHYEATIEMLGRLVDECPDEAWDVRDEPAPIWQQLYHVLLGLDYWVRDPDSAFEMPAFHTDEAGVLKGRAETVISRADLAAYRDGVFERCRAVLAGLDLASFVRDRDAGGVMLSMADHVIDQLRHVHHHMGSMHSQLRRRTGSHPPYVSHNERVALGEG